MAVCICNQLGGHSVFVEKGFERAEVEGSNLLRGGCAFGFIRQVKFVALLGFFLHVVEHHAAVEIGGSE